MSETWAPISGFGNAYSVSTMGNVQRTSPKLLRHRKCDPWLNFSPTPCSQSKNPGGYMQVRIGPAGAQKTVSVHKLVAVTFIQNPNGFMEINHIDGNKENNRVDNLEWTTRSKNLKHAVSMGLLSIARGEEHANAKLDNAAVLKIRNSGIPAKELAASLGVSLSLIYLVKQRKIWRHL